MNTYLKTNIQRFITVIVIERKLKSNREVQPRIDHAKWITEFLGWEEIPPGLSDLPRQWIFRLYFKVDDPNAAPSEKIKELARDAKVYTKKLYLKYAFNPPSLTPEA